MPEPRTDRDDWQPASVFHVGGYLAEELEERGWSVADCVDRMPGMPRGRDRAVKELALEMLIAMAWAPRGHVGNEVRMSEEEAADLSAALGVSAESLLKLDELWHKYPDRRVYEAENN